MPTSAAVYQATDRREEKQFKEAARHVPRSPKSRSLSSFDKSMSKNIKVTRWPLSTKRRRPCTRKAPLSPKQIKALREREHVSQTVLANYLNVTPNLISKWERGEKRPSGPALKLLTIVEKRGIVAVA